MKIKIDEIVIVEGKYDKIKLDSLLDATVISVNGFGLFKDEEKKTVLRALAEKKGALIHLNNRLEELEKTAAEVAVEPSDLAKVIEEINTDSQSFCSPSTVSSCFLNSLAVLPIFTFPRIR